MSLLDEPEFITAVVAFVPFTLAVIRSLCTGSVPRHGTPERAPIPPRPRTRCWPPRRRWRPVHTTVILFVVAIVLVLAALLVGLPAPQVPA